MMPTEILEGDTLGKKHQHYNKLVEDAVANKHYKLCKISDDDSDIDNLLKINIASKNRNVDYIIEVMKSNDMLYAATAIKKSTWLITEQQYANIINPEYLHTELLPNMNTKTFNKLMLQIRLNLKDESRVETFYEYLKETDSAYKWLQNCSIPFIENVIKNERRIPIPVFKRLCKKSPHFIAYYTRVTPSVYAAKQEILFLLKSHTTDVLNVLEHNDYGDFPILGKKKTEILMKKFPQKVFDNFDKYVYVLDLSVVTKYLNKKEIKTFLYKQVKTVTHYLSHASVLRHFVKNMPEEERLQFIKQTFIDRSDTTFLLSSKVDESDFDIAMDSYYWYEYVPFNVAFTEIKKLTRIENSSSVRCAMLSVLITCARRNQQHINVLLKFFYERYINEPFKFKIQFLNNLLSQISAHELEVETWNILDQLFYSVEVYSESKNNVQVQLCLQSIILYKVLNDVPVPEIVTQKMTYYTFKKIQRKLNQQENGKMFTYLLNSVFTKIQCKNIENESDFSETIAQLNNALTLIRDWNKNIFEFPFICKKIRELIKIKQENTWKTDMSCLYNINKTWRKHMFEESLSLCLCEETCLNALKHKPQLLTRHDKEIDTLRTNDAVSLRRLLAKLRVYWPHSLAQHWTKAYLQNLNKPSGQKAVFKGLFALLPQNQIIDMAQKHAPEDFKINWGKTDQDEIMIRKNIANHLHVVRPLIPLDTVLWYAKGDYLQYAVPSLTAIMSILSGVESRVYVPKLLEEPVSLQKFGLHLAFLKLTTGELKTTFLKIWNTTKNSTIRLVLFKHTFAYICKVNNANDEKELWELLSMFIEKLSSGENREIYKCLAKVENIPINKRAEFYVKSYEFLSSLPESAKCEKYVKGLIQFAPKIMGSLDEDFVANKLLSPVKTKFCSYGSEFIEVFACYILWGKTEEVQLQRFKSVVVPAMEQAFLIWNNGREENYYVKGNFKKFIRALMWNFKKYVTLNKIIIPVKLFVEIKTKMEEKMPLLENYVLYTSWKLITKYVKLMDDLKICSAFESSNFSESDIAYGWLPSEMENVWEDFHLKISPTLGPMIVECLKEDVEQHFPSIYWLFADAFNNMFNELFFQGLGTVCPLLVLETLKHMLNDRDFTPSYLVVCKATPKVHIDDKLKRIRSEIRKKITSHPSQEVQIHYHNEFWDIQEDEVNVKL